MRIGTTGTRQGITDKQKASFEMWLAFRPLIELAHGAAIGADEYVACRTASHGLSMCVAMPSDMESQTSQKAIEVSKIVHEPMEPLERNHDIVDYCHELIAFPATMAEEQRSGTWATIRYARKKLVPITIFWPDGWVTTETHWQDKISLLNK